MKNLKIEIKWALLFVVMTLAWITMEKLCGLYDVHIDKHPIVTNFIAIPAITLYVFALIEKRNKFYGGYITYGQGFMSGLYISLLVTLISPLTQYIVSEIIAPEYFPNVIKYSIEHELMTQEAADALFNLKSYIIQGLIGAPIMGIITTLIVMLFVKRKPKA